MSKGLVLHLRLTKKCNADCSYCSSWQDNNSTDITPDGMLSSIEYLFDKVMPLLNIYSQAVTIQYVGGEILTYPSNDLKQVVHSVRDFMGKRNIKYIDGVQTNLIGSKRRIDELISLFGRRIGTSVETIASDRTLRGSAERYKTAFNRSIKHTKAKGLNIGSVFTMDSKTYRHSLSEYRLANKEGRNITIRHVFEGGKAVNLVTNEMLTKSMKDIYLEWFMNSAIIVEPLFGMLQNRLATLSQGESKCRGCHFQSDCASRSFNIEPNGDIYVCYDLADAERMCLGNAIEKRFNFSLWNKINNRQSLLPEDCSNCTYLTDCQGGCLVETLEQGGGLYDKTPYCDTWKSLFSTIDKSIQKVGFAETQNWIDFLDTKEVAYVNVS